MLSRAILKNGALIPTLLRTSKPCVVAAPKLLHTSMGLQGYKLPEYPDKVRLGFVPEEWFQAFYNKTGVTGPYVFGAGFLLYLLNKEIYILGPETMHGIAIFTILIYGIKKLGPMVAANSDKYRADRLQEYENWKETATKGLREGIEEEKKELWRLDGRHHLFDAKRENVALQLETEFRERQLSVANAVKQRLDYHVNLENLKTRMEQQHMVKWITENVISSITPKQEKALVDKCISDLKNMSATA